MAPSQRLRAPLGLVLSWLLCRAALPFVSGPTAPRRTRLARRAFPAPETVFSEDWQEEAQRCWALGDDGLPLGFLPDMVPAGKEYHQLSRSYEENVKKPLVKDDRPWRRVEEAEAPFIRPFDKRMETFKKAMDYIGEAKGVMADVGCGEGFMGRRLLQEGFESVIAMDNSWMALEQAREAAEREGLGPEQGLLLLRADMQRSPFREESIDFVWWGMGVHTVQDPGVVLAQLAKALKPGGRIMATTYGRPGYRNKELEEQAKLAGFSQVEVVVGPEIEMTLQATK